MKTQTHLKRQAGLTAIELIVGIAVLALILLYAVPKVNGMFEAKQEETLISDIAMLVGGAKKMRGIRSSYAGVTCNGIASQKYASLPWTSCTGSNPQGGDYTLASSGATLTVTATGLETNFCARVENAIEPSATSAACAGGTLTVTFRG
ncbi:prepilin-type N-terminal cleavage/methylation domain-containing protein [Gilvimarinus polysaccharolyticus]|uniref:prepilin-type N-terminal cleavage/methylation domain-containing protein n=1 Tax=Gilvimarinus polysaccharolyticus TaxID=863921 RepID=UPI0006732A89|nr:prepilin-type N-terminal cleavage/methylation domain-containing protein [Gilvimarinus polysaccharolyticus]